MTNTMEPAVAREVAEDELKRFLTTMDLVVDESGLGEEDRSAHEKQLRVIVDAIMTGSLIIDDDGQPVYTPTVGIDRSPITFYEPDGGALMASDQHKKGQDMKRFFAMLAAMTRQPPVRFVKLKQRDLRVVQAIGVLFLS